MSHSNIVGPDGDIEQEWLILVCYGLKWGAQDTRKLSVCFLDPLEGSANIQVWENSDPEFLGQPHMHILYLRVEVT